VLITHRAGGVHEHYASNCAAQLRAERLQMFQFELAPVWDGARGRSTSCAAGEKARPRTRSVTIRPVMPDAARIKALHEP
jgi:hypothetical protein